MKVSTKGRYALRTMIDLTVNNTGNPIPEYKFEIYGTDNFFIDKSKISKKRARK